MQFDANPTYLKRLCRIILTRPIWKRVRCSWSLNQLVYRVGHITRVHYRMDSGWVYCVWHIGLHTGQFQAGSTLDQTRTQPKTLTWFRTQFQLKALGPSPRSNFGSKLTELWKKKIPNLHIFYFIFLLNNIHGPLQFFCEMWCNNLKKRKISYIVLKSTF